MQTNDANRSAERRFFSDQLMLELGQKLIEEKLITRGQVDELNSRRTLTGEDFDRLLIKEKVVDELDVLRVLAGLTNIPFEHMAKITIEPQAVRKMPARVAIRYDVMPVAFKNGVITLASYRAPNPTSVDGLRMLLNTAIDWILCAESEISKSIKHFYGLGAETIDHIGKRAELSSEVKIEGLDISAESADEGIVKFVNQVISEAIRMNATDIHIEPFENSMRLRYRIDGILQEIPIPKGVESWRKAIASCVKIMADMNIAERRRPHDGRINVRFGTDEFDLRVSILPTGQGETVNMRILNRKTAFIDMKHLGLNERQKPTLEYLSSLPHGVVLLTGPTGSGKTTTLYALLAGINNSEVKIITVEDPIEYQIHGINQIQVHSQIGLTFASILRSILRHDPDIVLIGEIRDSETADIAVRASLTGHLVFSTLHTNDAPSAVARLTDMGVEPYLISSCLEGIIAQRLVRRICDSCAQPSTPDETIVEEIATIFPDKIASANFLHGNGCPDCNFTGYLGRIALFEMMVMNDPIRNMVVHQRPSNEIKRLAIEHGLVTLRRDGWERAMQGITTIEEVLRVARKTDLDAIQPGL